MAFKKGSNCFFIYGFEKSEKSNISTTEEKAFKIIAKALLTYSTSELATKIADSALIEVEYEQK